MDEKGVTEVLVVDTFLEKHFLGIVDEEAITKKAQDLGVTPSELNAEQCMRPALATAPETSTMQECYKIMDYNKMETLVILDDEGHVCGILPLMERSGVIQ
jgi:predicted transcriptional regulator